MRNSGCASNSDVREDSDVKQVDEDGYAAWRVNTMEIASGGPPAEFTISKSQDWLQTVISVMSTEMAGGNPPADRDICESLEVLQRAGSVTAVVSEKWMERFVMKPKVICLDDSAPDEVRMSVVIRAYRTRYLQWYPYRQ